MSTEDRQFPLRGKWDFESDDMRLKAHDLLRHAQDYDAGFKAGHLAATRYGWARPISVAMVLVAITVCATITLMML